MTKKNYGSLEQAYRRKLAVALWENRNVNMQKRDLENQIEEIGKNLEFMRHEMKNPTGVLIGLNQNLVQLWDAFTDEEKKEYLMDNVRIAEELNNLVEFTSANLGSNKQDFYLEIPSRDLVKNQEKLMKDNKIGINYRTPERDPTIEIYQSEPLMRGVIGTLLKNSIEWIPENHNIDLGMRQDKGDNLRIFVENFYGEKKERILGEDRGIGLKRAKGLIKKIGGEVSTYQKPQIIHDVQYNHYRSNEKIGSNRAIKSITPEDSVYGVEVKIPMKKLRKQ